MKNTDPATFFSKFEPGLAVVPKKSIELPVQKRFALDIFR